MLKGDRNGGKNAAYSNSMIHQIVQMSFAKGAKVWKRWKQQRGTQKQNLSKE